MYLCRKTPLRGHKIAIIMKKKQNSADFKSAASCPVFFFLVTRIKDSKIISNLQFFIIPKEFIENLY